MEGQRSQESHLTNVPPQLTFEKKINCMKSTSRNVAVTRVNMFDEQVSARVSVMCTFGLEAMGATGAIADFWLQGRWADIILHP